MLNHPHTLLESDCPARDAAPEFLHDQTIEHCAHCRMDVHNISVLTQREAQAIIASGTAQCIRYDVATDGKIRHARRHSPGTLRGVLAWAAMGVVGAIATACDEVKTVIAVEDDKSQKSKTKRLEQPFMGKARRDTKAKKHKRTKSNSNAVLTAGNIGDADDPCIIY